MYTEKCVKKIVILLLLSCFTYESHCMDTLIRNYHREEESARRECGLIGDDELNRRINTPTTMPMPNTNAHELIRNIYREERKRRDLRKETERLNNLENSANQMPLDELFRQIKNTESSRDLEILNKIYSKKKKQRDVDVLISQTPLLMSEIEEMSKDIRSLKEQITEFQQQKYLSIPKDEELELSIPKDEE